LRKLAILNEMFILVQFRQYNNALSADILGSLYHLMPSNLMQNIKNI